MFLLLIYILFSILISRSILQANIFNIASLAIISYWITYPLDSINFVLNNQVLFEAIDNIKEKGIYLYAIFGFSFLIGVFVITKINPRRLKFYPNINSKNNLFFISTFLGILGLFCFSYTYNFDINEYFYLNFKVPRIETKALLSEASNALPYSIFCIPSVTVLLIAIKKYGFKRSFTNSFFTIIISLINLPILFSYIIEGERSALIKLILIGFFTIGLTKRSVEEINQKTFLIEKFRINKKILKNRIKVMLILFISVFILAAIAIGRNDRWESFTNISEHSTGEFRGVNYTIEYALARNNLDILKTDKMFTWKNIIFYPLPTYVYKGIFKEKKPPNIGAAIGIDTKNHLYGVEGNMRFGFGLSPVAEGFINLGYFGVFFIGLVYGLAIGLLQTLYNKISLENISLIDILILNTLGIVPLIMRSGSAGIYNWIFSCSFVILLPLLIIELFKTKRNAFKK